MVRFYYFNVLLYPDVRLLHKSPFLRDDVLPEVEGYGAGFVRSDIYYIKVNKGSVGHIGPISPAGPISLISLDIIVLRRLVCEWMLKVCYPA